MAMIPQDPTLFAGTIRFNLDPMGEFSDVQLWDVLEKTYLKHTVVRLKQVVDCLSTVDQWSARTSGSSG